MSVYVVGLTSEEKSDLLAKDLSVVRKPEGVGEPDIRFDTDHSGDAAVYVQYPVSKKFKPTKQRINVLLTFSEAVHDHLRALRLDSIPYVQFKETDI